MMDEPPRRYWETDLSDGQEQVLSLLLVTSGFASICASLTLIYVILALHSSFSSSYTRLILGLSIFDVASSLTNAAQPFLLPHDPYSNSRVWSKGNNATCDLLGFFVQFSTLGAILYNGALSLFFFMVVRVGMTPKRFSKTLEVFCHAFIILITLATASTGLVLHIYGQAKFGISCWITDVPRCEEFDDVECIGAKVGWIIAGLPLALVFIWIILSNTLIYLHMRRTLREKSQENIGKQIGEISEQTQHEICHVESGDAAEIREKDDTPEESSEQLTEEELSNIKMQEMVSQALLYVVSFFFSFGWLFIAKIIESDPEFHKEKESSIFLLLVLTAMFSPLQGVFTLMVYTRPGYVQCRLTYPKESRLWCVRRAWAGSLVRPIKTKRRDRHSAVKSEQESNIIGGWSSFAFSRAEFNESDGANEKQEKNPAKSSEVKSPTQTH